MNREYLKRIALPGMLLGIAATLHALPPGISVAPSGEVELAGLAGQVVCLGTGFQRNAQSARTVTADPGYPVLSDRFFEVQGSFALHDGKRFQLQQKWEDGGAGNIDCRISLRAIDTPVECVLLCFSLELPFADYSGRQLTVDGAETAAGHWTRDRVRSVSIPCGSRTLTVTGDFKLAMRDNRGNGVQSYSLRFSFRPDQGKIRESDFRAAFRIDLAAQRTVALKGADAAGFLRQLRVAKGEFRRGALVFDIDGSMLNLGRGESAELGDSGNERYLYLLHNADSAKAKPELAVRYADGTTKRIELREGTDFSPVLRRLPNGALSAADDRGESGLYISRFDLGETKCAAIAFSNTGEGRYSVAGLIRSSERVETSALDSIFFVRENEIWRPMEKVKDVLPGSALDFSRSTEAPAGKFGWVKADENGHFTFEDAPGKRIRFLGANVVGAGNFPDHDNARRLVGDMAAVGYNTVRLHHFDGRLTGPKAKDSLDFDPGQLDRLDFLFVESKRRGLYITIDLHSARAPREINLSSDDYKTTVPVNAEAFANWKAYARKLLEHVNPHTGLAWGKDPALFSVVLLNEHAPYQNWDGNDLRRKYYSEAYGKYLREKGMYSEQAAKERGAEFHRFLRDVTVRFIREATAFLREDLGYRGMITHVNHRNQLVNGELRELLDFVDNHQYWDHPMFLPGKDWSFPVLHSQMSSLAAGVWNPRTIFHSRLFGKPYTVTEYNYTFPNKFRAEIGPLYGGLASLQDWDGLYRFAWWGHMQDRVVHANPINRFDIAEDSLSLLAERLIWALFVRGDASPAEEALAWPYGESMYRDWTTLADNVPPLPFQQLGLYCRTGLLREGTSFPGVKLLTPRKYGEELTEEERRFDKLPAKRSANKEILTGPAGCTVVTPKTESLALFGGDRAGKLLRVEKADSFQVVSALAMDGAQLASSREILLFHQSDLLNSNMRFANESCQTVEGWGETVPLIRRATATARLRLPAGSWSVRSIGLDGAAKREIVSEFKDGELVFPLDTARDGGTMVYQITVK